MKTTITLLLSTLLAAMLLTGCGSSANTAPPIAYEIANKAGLDAFDQVTELRYTFNVRLSPDKEVTRSWIWKPQIGEVTMIKPGEDPFTYNQAAMMNPSEEMQAADKAFINDKYWLVFPFQLVWDEGVTVTSAAGKSPIDGKDCRVVDVQYEGDGGYTPGDLYKLYVDDEGTVMEWGYHPGGAAEAARATRWTDYQEKGGLMISMMRESETDFQVWFTDVEVKTE